VFHYNTISRKNRLDLLPPVFVFIKNPLLLSISDRNFRFLEVLDDLFIRILEEKIVVDERLTRHYTEEVDQPLSRLANVSSDSFAAGGRIENGEIDIGVGVSRVEETKQANSLLCFPEFVNSVHIDEVIEEAAMLVPALAGADGAQDGDERREFGVN
jgi:hypothetical protein